MSVKRQATSDLNHENWDQEEPAEDKEEGYKIASSDVLEKRVIRTAKRRSQNTGVEAKKSVFSGFSGFNKAQPSSFDFLANLTNGNNSSSTSVFGSPDTKPASISSTGLFSATTTPKDKTTESSVFGVSFSNNNTEASVFGSKPDSTMKENPLLSQSSSTTPLTGVVKPNVNLSQFMTPQIPSTIFGMNSGNNLMSKPLSTSTENNTTPFKMQPISTSTQESSGNKKPVNDTNKNDDKKINYYSKLKGLNESVSDWIKKHVEKTPLCILTPIFKDYEKHLKEIQEEYENSKIELNKIIESTSKDSIANTNSQPTPPVNTIASSVFSNTSSTKSLFSTNTQDKPSGFSFGVSTGPSTGVTATAGTNQSAGFSFGMKSSPQNTNSTIPTVASSTNGTPFSFGIGKPFSFNSNVKTPEEPVKQDDDNEDEPPKVEFTAVVEENSVYDKKCKIFVKKDGNFIDKGVGTLYLKKIEDSSKHQLLVRANTNLGNVLLNMILSKSLPTQRMGKNNVMIVCIPTPDAQPPPVPILIRVKTPEEADELLSTLDKFKA